MKKTSKSIRASIEKTFKSFGFERLKLPVLYDSQLFIKGLGEQVKSTMFTLSHKKKELALRPEMTSLVINHSQKLLEHNKEDTILPLRFYYSGSVFRKGKGKQEQTQIGTETIGSNNFYDAENIALAISCLETLGIQNYKITLSNVGILNDLIHNMDTDKAFKSIVLENIKDKEQGIAFLKKLLKEEENNPAIDPLYKDVEALKKLDHKENVDLIRSLIKIINPDTSSDSNTNDEIIQGILDKVKRQSQSKAIKDILFFVEALYSIKGPYEWPTLNKARSLLETKGIPLSYIEDLNFVCDFLIDYGIPHKNIVLDFGAVRNLHYYNGLIFDVECGGITVARGGRYELPSTDESVAGFGFIFELEKIEETKGTVDILVLVEDYDYLKNILGIIKKLRSEGISVLTMQVPELSLDVSLEEVREHEQTLGQAREKVRELELEAELGAELGAELEAQLEKVRELELEAELGAELGAELEAQLELERERELEREQVQVLKHEQLLEQEQEAEQVLEQVRTQALERARVREEIRELERNLENVRKRARNLEKVLKLERKLRQVRKQARVILEVAEDIKLYNTKTKELEDIKLGDIIERVKEICLKN